MKTLTCSVAGCEGVVIARGLCRRHYQRLYRTGSPADPDFTNAGKTCAVPDCDAPAFVRGLCAHHDYATQRYGGPFSKAERIVRFCSVPGCTREARAHGFCDTHHERQERGQPLDPPIQVEHKKWHGARCSVGGCEREVYARGWCSTHYHQDLWRVRRGRQSTRETDASIDPIEAPHDDA